MKDVKKMALELQLNAAQFYLNCDKQCFECSFCKGEREHCWPKTTYETLKESHDPVVVLALRDGMSLKEACFCLDEVLGDVEEAVARGDFIEAVEIWMEGTGLEVDYLENII